MNREFAVIDTGIQVIAISQYQDQDCSQENEGFLLFKNTSTAINFYDQNLAKEPNNYHLWHKKADVLLMLEKYSEALECYDQVIRINPDTETGYRKKGDIFLALGKYSEAIDVYQKALQINPDDETIKRHLAVAKSIKFES
ncbi:MAG: tetratricopeptide repeat protein [Microcoleaceae cyanobacterium]